jgi:hypothetical protein
VVEGDAVELLCTLSSAVEGSVRAWEEIVRGVLRKPKVEEVGVGVTGKREARLTRLASALE